MSKRNFDFLKPKENPLMGLKVSSGFIDLKISKTVREYYTEFLSKITCYENSFQEIEILSHEMIKLMDKVLSVNRLLLFLKSHKEICVSLISW